MFFRDFGILTTLAMQALFWGTPIVYPVEILPQWLIPCLIINPLLAPVSTAQALMLGTAPPGGVAWISTAVVAVLAGLTYSQLHRRHLSDLMDNL